MRFRPAIVRGVAAVWMAAVLSHGLAAAGDAQIPTIPLPSDLKVDPPAADVPASVSRYSAA